MDTLSVWPWRLCRVLHTIMGMKDEERPSSTLSAVLTQDWEEWGCPRFCSSLSETSKNEIKQPDTSVLENSLFKRWRWSSKLNYRLSHENVPSPSSVRREEVTSLFEKRKIGKVGKNLNMVWSGFFLGFSRIVFAYINTFTYSRCERGKSPFLRRGEPEMKIQYGGAKIMLVSAAMLIYFHCCSWGHREKRLSYFPLLGFKLFFLSQKPFFFFAECLFFQRGVQFNESFIFIHHVVYLGLHKHLLLRRIPEETEVTQAYSLLYLRTTQQYFLGISIFTL